MLCYYNWNNPIEFFLQTTHIMMFFLQTTHIMMWRWTIEWSMHNYIYPANFKFYINVKYTKQPDVLPLLSIRIPGGYEEAIKKLPVNLTERGNDSRCKYFPSCFDVNVQISYSSCISVMTEGFFWGGRGGGWWGDCRKPTSVNLLVLLQYILSYYSKVWTSNGMVLLATVGGKCWS